MIFALIKNNKPLMFSKEEINININEKIKDKYIIVMMTNDNFEQYVRRKYNINYLIKNSTIIKEY